MINPKALQETLVTTDFLQRWLGRLRSIQGLPSIMPHGMIDTPHGVDFSFSFPTTLIKTTRESTSH